MGTRLRSSLKAMVTREVLLRPFRRSKLVGGRKILRVTTKAVCASCCWVPRYFWTWLFGSTRVDPIHHIQKYLPQK